MKKNVVKIEYDNIKDQYQLLSSDDNGKTWGFVTGVFCVNSVRTPDDEEPQFIHHSIIEQLNQFVSLGYTLVV